MQLKGLDEPATKEITEKSMKVVREYIKLYYELNPEIKIKRNFYQSTFVVIVNRHRIINIKS